MEAPLSHTLRKNGQVFFGRLIHQQINRPVRADSCNITAADAAFQLCTEFFGV